MQNKFSCLLLPILLLLFFFSNCKKATNQKETNALLEIGEISVFIECDSLLLNTLWKLESFETIGDEIVKPSKNQVYNVQFFEDNILTGISDCNDIRGNYQIASNDTLKIYDLFTTKVLCGSNSMYDRYYQAFLSAKLYKLNKDTLHIYYDDSSRLNFLSK